MIYLLFVFIYTMICTSSRLTVTQRVPLVGQKLGTSARGLLVAEGVIRPVFSVSALTWFIIYI